MSDEYLVPRFGQSFGQPAQTPSTKPKLLKLRLVATANDEKDRYAVIPCPQTYEEAQISAIEVFQRYMEDSTPNSVVIRCAVVDKKGDWLWADIKPRDWKIVIEEFNHEVGVFPFRPQLNTTLSEYSFERGSIFVTFGTTNGYTTTWTSFDKYNYVIDRPKSYKEAIEYITSLQSNRRVFSNVNLTGKDLTFYAFTSTRQGLPTTDNWDELPPLARSDDRVWRALVPASGQILGFKVKAKS